MDVKRVAVAGVVVESWCELEVHNVRKSELRSYLPAEHECIGKRGLLSLTASVRRTGCRYYWLRRCRGWSNWVRRVGIVIDKLAKVREDVDFQPRFRWRWRRYIFPVFTVGDRLCCSATDGERVFPLFSQPFRVNVVIPDHSRIHERVRHSASSKRKVREAFVTSIRLADEDAVVTLCEWSAATGRGRRCIRSVSYVR